MNEVWIIDAVRTPRSIGKPGRGAAFGLHPQRLLASALAPLAKRNHLVTADLDDVVIGCGTPFGKQGYCIARMGSLLAGYDERAPGSTIERFCGSALSAVNMAVAGIGAGMQDLVVAGGVEMMSYTASLARPPLMDADNPALRESVVQFAQGIAADLIATREGFSRADVDAYALASHQRAARAVEEGIFSGALVPIVDDEGRVVLGHEEYVRPQTTAADLAALQPSFAALMDRAIDDSGLTNRMLVERAFPDQAIEHVHTPGNSSGVVDGASAVLLASPEYARAHGLKPRARVVSIATAGDSPQFMLNAAVPAARKALAKAGMEIADIDLLEVNEAFAAVPMKLMKDLKVDMDRVNVNGGAIALGHPIGATGAMLVGSLIDALEHENRSTGLVTMCTGGGMAPCVIAERV